MAEFSVVMRQARRMCATFENCGRCRLVSRRMECPIEGMPQKWPTEPEILAEIEHIVMDWAEKNPEPRYPTWIEWWDENFSSKGRRMLTPCSFVPPAELGCSIGMDDCMNAPYKCWHTPIPADVAEKLGVKPIGG